MATHLLDGKTPFEALHGQSPDLSAICTWGFPVLVHNANGLKLDVHACEACWLGSDVNTRAHRVFWPGLGNVTVKWNVYFGTPALLKGEGRTMQVAGSEQADAPPSPSTLPAPKESDVFSHAETPTLTHTNESELQAEPPVQLHHSACLWKPSHIMRNIQSREGIPAQHVPGLQIPGALVEEAEEAGEVWTVTDGSPALLENFDGLEHMFLTKTTNVEALKPWLLTEARWQPDWLLWEKAIQDELATLKAAGTWRLEEAPPNANIISSKWVFKAKKDAAGNIAQYKARLVAQGFSQIDGVDYDDTYAPVACLVSSHAIIAMANHLCLELHQVDIKGAYLNGMLNEGEVLYSGLQKHCNVLQFQIVCSVVLYGMEITLSIIEKK
jgi:reverse transcriptase-like protein